MPIPKPFTGKVIGLDGYELAAVQVLLSEHMATRETGNTTPSKLEIGQQSPRWTWSRKSRVSVINLFPFHAQAILLFTESLFANFPTH